jgi:hypothetical protein
MYLVNTRPNICFSINTLSQFTVDPSRVHWVVANHVLSYLCGTIYYGLEYQRGDGVHLVGYIDSDWALCVSDQNISSGCCFSQKKMSVALSSVEDEYMVSSQASFEALWLCKLLVGLFGVQLRPTLIYYDNQSCIKLLENPIFHDRSKHIEIHYHIIRDYV